VTAYLIKRYFWEIKIRCFDSDYAKTIGISVYGIDILIAFLITFAIIMGMRSVGVVLVSAMLIAPAVTARQYSDKLQTCFFLAIFFGMASGFLGNVSSFALGNYYQKIDPAARLSFSTGPMIVFCATLFCLFALLFAPKRGLFLRYMRTFFFKMSCLSENILKALWREDTKGFISLEKIQEKMAIPSLFLYILLLQLKREGWLQKENHKYKLSKEGLMRAEQIVRLHRLWELYLVNYLGVDATRVHASAEEMEHILTPAIEKELSELLDNPVLDPHRQPIPKRAY
jgi:manganese/zinc/iron transport system permease protein